MIRVLLIGKDRGGRWYWAIRPVPTIDYPIEGTDPKVAFVRHSWAGCSNEPLFDACREIIATLETGCVDPGPPAPPHIQAEIVRRYGDLSQRIGLFDPGCPTPRVHCSIKWGAAHSVLEGPCRFVKYRDRHKPS